jgi:hypothetical protein
MTYRHNRSRSEIGPTNTVRLTSPPPPEVESDEEGNLYERFQFTQHAYDRPVIPRPVLEELIVVLTNEIKARGKCYMRTSRATRF